jgi:hypothetical protein
MENLDKILMWAGGFYVAIVPLVSFIVSKTATPRDDEIWGNIQLIFGRFFSAKSFKDPDTGKSNWSVPVLQSAKPKKG